MIPKNCLNPCCLIVAATLIFGGRIPVAKAHGPLNLGQENAVSADTPKPGDRAAGVVPRRIDPAQFSLRDTSAKPTRITLPARGQLLVLAVLGAECPLAKLYAPRLQELSEMYGQRVRWIGVDANAQDSLRDLQEYATTHELRFPLWKDPSQELVRALGATRTPEVFVIDSEGSVQYSGRIDDQFDVGIARSKANNEYLRDALEALLAGQAVSVRQVDAVGCLIGRLPPRQADSAVTYSRQISRLLNRHCVECHRPGEIGPFSLTSYDEVVGWAETLAEVVEQQRMPPWHADPRYGEFHNARLMTQQEKQTLFDWVNAGAPEGDPSELPKLPQRVDGWRLPREPDLVVSMSRVPFEVAKTGTIEYQYFVVDPGFEEDTWVSGAEIIPGDRRVVHHAIVFTRAPDSLDALRPGWLTAYVPGQRPMVLGEGRARRIPAGSKLVFQMHYTPIGSPTEDLTRVGLLLADPKTVQEEVISMISLNREFEIPPGAAAHTVTSNLSGFPSGGKLLGFGPHMHLRGKSFTFVGHRHNGELQTLLNVPNYDFNWQHLYRLAEPIELDAFAKIECKATFDNSRENPWNPDPGIAVRWGDQSWEEMSMAFFDVTVPLARLRQERVADREQEARQRREKASRKADEMLARMDKNQDGVISRKEVSQAFAAFAFGRMDRNRDDRISHDEAMRYAEKQLR